MSRKTREPWYESDNPTRVARGASWRGAIWVLALVLFFGLVGAGTWAVKVGVSDVKGRGDVVRKTNDADNRIFAQQKFEDRYQDILASDRKLDQAAADKAADPKGEAATRYTGLVNYCLSEVGRYNADARKITQAPFLAADLPVQIDTTNAATDCKESSK